MKVISFEKMLNLNSIFCFLIAFVFCPIFYCDNECVPVMQFLHYHEHTHQLEIFSPSIHSCLGMQLILFSVHLSYFLSPIYFHFQGCFQSMEHGKFHGKKLFMLSSLTKIPTVLILYLSS